jgi:glutamyl-tRNA reductase
MKYDPKESYESWAKRVQMFEQGHALQRIANGEPADLVLQDMARRMTDKLLHPYLLKLKENAIIRAEHDAEKSKKSYKESYFEKVERIADHVVNDNKVNNNEK